MSVVEQSLRDRVADILGVPSSEVDSSKSLSGLGLDSLGLLQLTANIEPGLGDEWPGGSSDQLTIASLAELLKERNSSVTDGPASMYELMLADSRLPSDIFPGQPPACALTSILLTGATGFLGAYLLSSLLRTTAAEVVCLVRPGRVDPAERIRRNLGQYGIWEDGFTNRIHTITGDLSQPRLGLPSLRFDRIAERVDGILHGAASVNWVQSYAALRASNVFAVRELLRLACRGKAKPFHFVSTLGVCYSSQEMGEITEASDPFCNVNSIHLAYAQSKLVAETLVRTAAARGLPCAIYRPSFISGDSVTGISNTSDFLSRLIKGCVQMSAAPDMDWSLDAVPVEFAGTAISRLMLACGASGFHTFHLANSRPRHWREIILWMNLYGYRVELLPYEEWLTRLERAMAEPDHPLRNLAPFFMRQPTPAPGLYLPHFYEEGRKAKVNSAATSAALASQGLECPALSAGLLERYFSSFIEGQFLKRPTLPSKAQRAPLRMDPAFFGRAFPDSEIIAAMPTALAADHSAVGELTSWKYGQSVGIHGYRVTLRTDHEPVDVDVVVKVKTTDTGVREVGDSVARLCSGALAEAYPQFSSLLGLQGFDRRELAFYQRGCEHVRPYAPGFHGGWVEDGHTILVLEKLSGMVLMNSVDCLDQWRPQHVHAAIDGLAEIHAVWYGRAEHLPSEMFVQPYPTPCEMENARPLWAAMASYAGPLFSKWAGPGIHDLQRHLIETLGEWWSASSEMPRTLIHNDFNPRNLAFRASGRLCVYDWELATSGLPQHDLAELLCFVLGPHIRIGDVHDCLERHRAALELAAGISIDEDSWLQGFRFSLFHLLLNRLPAYAMIHRFRKQNFLERAVQSWMALFEGL